MEGEVGLVLQGSVRDGIIRVSQVLANSAASASCAVFPGDQVASVDGQSTVGMTAAHVASLLTGKPGSMVVLEVREQVALKSAAKEPQTLCLQRRAPKEYAMPPQPPDIEGSNAGEEAYASVQAAEEALLAHVSQEGANYITRLRELVAIPSVSAEASTGGAQRRSDLQRATSWLKAWAQYLRADSVHQTDGADKDADGAPWPVLVASFEGRGAGFVGAGRRLVVHLHFDVLPAYQEDGWEQDPFLLTQTSGKLCGRIGGKADVCAWLNAIAAFRVSCRCTHT